MYWYRKSKLANLRFEPGFLLVETVSYDCTEPPWTDLGSSAANLTHSRQFDSFTWSEFSGIFIGQPNSINQMNFSIGCGSREWVKLESQSNWEQSFLWSLSTDEHAFLADHRSQKITVPGMIVLIGPFCMMQQCFYWLPEAGCCLWLAKKPITEHGFSAQWS